MYVLRSNKPTHTEGFDRNLEYIFVKSMIFPLILFIIMPVVTIFICSFDSTKNNWLVWLPNQPLKDFFKIFFFRF